MSSRELVTFIVRALAQQPEAVEVREQDDGRDRSMQVRLAEGDKGRVIGKEGRTAKAIRTLLAVASAREGRRAKLEILD